ncbi:hypothetical protein K443DRAFT_672885 [Laccaria amethystina LaAM-08-1]|uniref:Uncharacterized protein n=1 Tax=Laccaria amethystina LaAM-08-1 TaxID=1095629 RepID=A0A0C9XSV9_9AGAR|nr:hypothetical protein K443DRAFT_672885 [Laccaria amethystina LaAM-08-1]
MTFRNLKDDSVTPDGYDRQDTSANLCLAVSTKFQRARGTFQIIGSTFDALGEDWEGFRQSKPWHGHLGPNWSRPFSNLSRERDR